MFAVEVGISFFRVKNWQEKIMAAITPLKTLQKMEKKKERKQEATSRPSCLSSEGEPYFGQKRRKSQWEETLTGQTKQQRPHPLPPPPTPLPPPQSFLAQDLDTPLHPSLLVCANLF